MAEEHDKIWDEYDWERFLQQQEYRTEKYLELIEKYLDHPQRDEIIAKEMGWFHLLGGDSRDWEDDVDARFEQEGTDLLSGGEAEKVEDLEADAHPLYRATIAFAMELEDVFEDTPSSVQEHPATVTLHTKVSLASTKLAAALNDEIDEPGMSIAYLKRALHAFNASLDAIRQLREGNLIDATRYERVRAQLFQIRDGIVTAMGELRAEFRRRFRS